MWHPFDALTGFWGGLMRKSDRYFKKNKGFSLVELIIAITIMVILAAVIGIAIIRYINKARKQVDVETAETIYKAAQLTIATSDDEIKEAWDRNYNRTKWTVTTNGETYQVECIAWARGSFDYKPDNGEFKNGWQGGVDEEDQWKWVLEFKRNLLQYGGKSYNTPYEVLPFKYRKTKDPYGTHTQYADSWIIYRRVRNKDDIKAEDYEIEVWIGYKENRGEGYGSTLVQPYYRLYPDTDKRFYKN